MTWIKLKNADGKGGVRYREHPARKHGAIPDRYYTLSYWHKGKSISEAVGWASEKWTPTECFRLLAEIKHNQSMGKGPCTLAELRKTQEFELRQAELRQKAEALSLDDYWATYYEHAARTKKAVSAEKEQSHYKHWLSPILGAIPLLKIDLLQWDLLVQTMTSAKKSKRTIEYVTGTLRRLLKHAYHRGLINVPPQTDEAEALLEEIKKIDPCGWRITKFAFLTGCRASEAFNLKWREVDRGRMLLLFPETKNRDARYIPLSQPIVDLLSEIAEGELDETVFKMTGKHLRVLKRPWTSWS